MEQFKTMKFKEAILESTMGQVMKEPEFKITASFADRKV